MEKVPIQTQLHRSFFKYDSNSIVCFYGNKYNFFEYKRAYFYAFIFLGTQKAIFKNGFLPLLKTTFSLMKMVSLQFHSRERTIFDTSFCESIIPLLKSVFWVSFFPKGEKLHSKNKLIEMEKQPINRPLSFLPVFEEALNGDISSVAEHYQVLLPAKDKPWALDDATVDRAIALHEEKGTFIQHYERQFCLWRKEVLTPNQKAKIEELEAKLPQLKTSNDVVLKLLYNIQPYTIDKITAMPEAELALLHLSGKLKF